MMTGSSTPPLVLSSSSMNAINLGKINKRPGPPIPHEPQLKKPRQGFNNEAFSSETQLTNLANSSNLNTFTYGSKKMRKSTPALISQFHLWLSIHCNENMSNIDKVHLLSSLNFSLMSNCSEWFDISVLSDANLLLPIVVKWLVDSSNSYKSDSTNNQVQLELISLFCILPITVSHIHLLKPAEPVITKLSKESPDKRIQQLSLQLKKLITNPITYVLPPLPEQDWSYFTEAEKPVQESKSQGWRIPLAAQNIMSQDISHTDPFTTRSGPSPTIPISNQHSEPQIVVRKTTHPALIHRPAPEFPKSSILRKKTNSSEQARPKKSVKFRGSTDTDRNNNANALVEMYPPNQQGPFNPALIHTPASSSLMYRTRPDLEYTIPESSIQTRTTGTESVLAPHESRHLYAGEEQETAQALRYRKPSQLVSRTNLGFIANQDMDLTANAHLEQDYDQMQMDSAPHVDSEFLSPRSPVLSAVDMPGVDVPPQMFFDLTRVNHAQLATTTEPVQETVALSPSQSSILNNDGMATITEHIAAQASSTNPSFSYIPELAVLTDSVPTASLDINSASAAIIPLDSKVHLATQPGSPNNTQPFPQPAQLITSIESSSIDSEWTPNAQEYSTLPDNDGQLPSRAPVSTSLSLETSTPHSGFLFYPDLKLTLLSLPAPLNSSLVSFPEPTPELDPQDTSSIPLRVSHPICTTYLGVDNNELGAPVSLYSETNKNCVWPQFHHERSSE